MSGHDLAVVDVETTGLRAAGSDRIIEIGIVRFSADGRLMESYSTLLNPGRDVGPTHIHGIRAKDVIDAPTFEEVAGDVASRLAGAVIGGHNVSFDKRFLTAEFDRVGVSLPAYPTICTLRMSHRLRLDLPNRKLGTCCEHYGIDAGLAHSAEADALSAGRLLLLFLEMARQEGIGELGALGCEPLPPPALASWPSLRTSGRTKPRTAGRPSISEPSYVASLVARLPVGDHEVEILPYLEVLDRVLEDRLVTSEEGDALGAIATEWGLTRAEAKRAHTTYFSQLVRVALSDGVISTSERRDLEQVGGLLGLSRSEVDTSITFGERSAHDGIQAADVNAPGPSTLAGSMVCFTGAFECCIDGSLITRERAIEIAEASGMVVSKNLTKKVDVLVVADPYTQSGKAKKAREYGTRAVAEAVFWQSLGIQVE